MINSEFENSNVLKNLKEALDGLPASPFYIGGWINEEVEQRLNQLQKLGVSWPVISESVIASPTDLNNGDGASEGWLTFLAMSWEDVRRMGGQYLQLAQLLDINDPYLLELFELALCVNEVRPLLLKKKAASTKYKKSSEELGVCCWCWREVPQGYELCHIHDDNAGDHTRRKAAKSSLKKARKLFWYYRSALSELRTRPAGSDIKDVIGRVNDRMKKLGYTDHARFLAALDDSGGPGYISEEYSRGCYYMCYEEEALRERLVSGFGLNLDHLPLDLQHSFLDQALLRAEAWLTISSKPY